MANPLNPRCAPRRPQNTFITRERMAGLLVRPPRRPAASHRLSPHFPAPARNGWVAATTAQLSPAQQAYTAALDRIEAERLTALSAPGANADQQSIVALRKMSAALIALRTAQLKAARQ